IVETQAEAYTTGAAGFGKRALQQQDLLFEAEHFSIGRGVGAGSCEVVESAVRRSDDMPRNEWRAFGCALFAALDAAFPFEHGPTVKTVLRELGKNCFEVDLAIAGRAEPSGAVDLGL